MNLIEKAKIRHYHNHRIISYFSTVEFPEVDYVIASGAIAYRCQNRIFHFEMIRNIYDAAIRAAAFNMLDAACFPEDELLIGHELEIIGDFCRNPGHRIEFIRGYLPDDFTMFMY